MDHSEIDYDILQNYLINHLKATLTKHQNIIQSEIKNMKGMSRFSRNYSNNIPRKTSPDIQANRARSSLGVSRENSQTISRRHSRVHLSPKLDHFLSAEASQPALNNDLSARQMLANTSSHSPTRARARQSPSSKPAFDKKFTL